MRISKTGRGPFRNDFIARTPYVVETDRGEKGTEEGKGRKQGTATASLTGLKVRGKGQGGLGKTKKEDSARLRVLGMGSLMH